MGMNCYDGRECLHWNICDPETCMIIRQVDKLQSQEHEDAPTQRIVYTGETTEVIPPQELQEGQIIRLQAAGTYEPDTMDFTVFQPRDDLSLTEEEVQSLRDRFLQTSNRVAEMWIPSLPPQEEEIQFEAGQSAMTRTYPKRHRCLVCWLVSHLPGHHRCPHGRLVCEQCEAEAAGW